MESTKEAAANVGASAMSGLEKTKATLQEKVEKVKAHDPVEKQMATERKEDKIDVAELNKQEAFHRNAAVKDYSTTGHPFAGTGTATHSTTGATGHPTGTHQMSAMPGHGTGQPMGRVVEGVVGSHPVGTNTGTRRTTTADNAGVQGAGPTGYGTGGSYN
ncbi:hypothetical protein UlMin_005155 [Ulmus minor]